MCGRFVIFTSEEYHEMKEILKEIAKRYKAGIGIVNTGEIFPTNIVPIITAGNSIGNNEKANKESIINHLSNYDMFPAKWGFDLKGKPIINSRSETVDVKPMFKKSFFEKRAIIPASAFYEWQKTNDKKQKNIIGLNSEKIMFMAGLYRKRYNPEGVIKNEFTILTCSASDEIDKIHHRMPVIIDRENIEKWLDPEANMELCKKLLKPFEGKLTIKKIA